MSTILLLGKHGQLGRLLQRRLATVGSVVALGRGDTIPYCGDLTQMNALRGTIRTLKPTIIINAGAYTHVDQAEHAVDHVMQINAHAPAVLADEAARINAWVIHYSTDYVFDGHGTHFWQETDPANPLNIYGLSKLDGDRAIQRSGCRHLIFRSSWIYSMFGNNFIRKILTLARERDILHVVDDQIGAPTSAELLAKLTVLAVQTILTTTDDVSGLYHVAAQGETSWYHYAQLIFQQMQKMKGRFKLKAIEPIATSMYPTVATRPCNSRLFTEKVRQVFSISLPPWEADVIRTTQALLTSITDV